MKEGNFQEKIEYNSKNGLWEWRFRDFPGFWPVAKMVKKV